MHATLNEAVIAKWKVRRKNHKMYTLIFGATIAVLAIALALANIWYNAVFALVLLVIALAYLSRVTLRCPNCSKIPGYVEWGPHSWNVDCCKHCHYWLVHPAYKSGPHMV